MRKLCLVLCVLALPLPARAQQTPALPTIGLPLPSLGLPPPAAAVPGEWRQRTPWEQPKTPAWEKPQLPPWEQRHVSPPPAKDGGGRRRGRSNVIYIPYPVAVQQAPQVIVVQQPPVTQIVHVEVPAAAPPPRVDEPSKPVEPPYVPSGDRTLYVIPGCYVGNVSPVNLKLPATCDITKLTTYVP
jgi:hypothetical protein